MTNNIDCIEHNRVIWNSRRGLLELDILLEGFVKSEYQNLDEDLRLNYQKLLTYDDQVLYDWFLKKDRLIKNSLKSLKL